MASLRTLAHEVRRSTLKRLMRLVPASRFAPPSKCEARPSESSNGPQQPRIATESPGRLRWNAL